MSFFEKQKKKLIIGGACMAIAAAVVSASGIPIPSEAFEPAIAAVYCWIWSC
jgi:hypothetical protein